MFAAKEKEALTHLEMALNLHFQDY